MLVEIASKEKRSQRELPARLDDVFQGLLEDASVLVGALVGANGLTVAGRTKCELSVHLVAAVGTYLLDDTTMIGSHLGETKSSGMIVQWEHHKFMALRVSQTLSLVLALRRDADILALQPKILVALSELDSLLDVR